MSISPEIFQFIKETEKRLENGIYGGAAANIESIDINAAVFILKKLDVISREIEDIRRELNKSR